MSLRINNARCVLHRWCLAAILATNLLPGTDVAQTYPVKPIRLIVTGVTGGSDDFHARIVAQKMGEVLGQQVPIDNRPGGGLIGRTAVINASPDGYTLLFGGVSMAGDRFINANATYDVMRDFAPVSMVVTYQFVLVVPNAMPARNVRDLIRLAKSLPGQAKFPSGGTGGLPYLSLALFNSKAGIDAIHVPYKSASNLFVELIGGQTDYYISPMASAMTHINGGKVRALAVTGARRSPLFPNLPTIAEAALPGYDVTSWMSILAPAKTPRPVIGALNRAVSQSLAASEVRDAFMKIGSEPMASSPEELARRMADGIEWFAQITKLAGIKPQ